jgi:hypothetical protein
MDLTGKIFEGIGAHTNPEIGRFIEETVMGNNTLNINN